MGVRDTSRGELTRSPPYCQQWKKPLTYKIIGADLRRTLLCYGVIGTQAGSGSWFIIVYTTYFLEIAGIAKPFQYSIMNTCIGFLGVNCGIFAMRHLVSRRFILIFGSIACGLCYLGMGVADSVPTSNSITTGKAILAMVAIWQFFYNGCVGAASYPVATELVSSRLRAWTVGSATSIGYVLAWLTSFCTPYFINPTALNWVSNIPSISESGSPFAVTNRISRALNMDISGRRRILSARSSLK